MNGLVSLIVSGPPPDNQYWSILPYSTKIERAWEVVEWCMDYADGDLFIEFWRDGEWYICNENLMNRHQYKDTLIVKARSDNTYHDDDKKPSFPLAICRYALKCGVRQGLIEPETITDDPLVKGRG
jgi:hypothetical protein